MASFIFVLLLPIGFFVYSLFENSWEQAQQDMLEKHQLIASAMVEPISIFITSRQNSLKTLGNEILEIKHQQLLEENSSNDIFEKQLIQEALDKYKKSYFDLTAISYISDLKINQISINEKYSKENTTSKIPSYLHLPLTKLNPLGKKHKSLGLISPIFKSTISNQPVILLKQYVFDNTGKVKVTLLSEISTLFITDMCSKISFGEKGHCAIVDQTGHVIAHPNKSWEKDIHNLSKLSVVQKMLDGKSGTTEFYSPFLKGDMVAGYSAIPKLGWGIMIPQPKVELTKTLDALRNNTLIWLMLGIIVALLVAYLLTQKITKPISTLMNRTRDISAGHDFISIGKVPKNSPHEINQLWHSISLLITGLQDSNKEVKRLNVSLNRDIDKATLKLQSMNQHLFEMSNKDYLTSLANRRCFSNQLENVISQNKNECIGLILIDIDRFKFINDEYGHEAGDLTLKHLSQILKKLARKEDLVARLGGDEFIIYVKNTKDKTLTKIAEDIRHTVEKSPIYHNGIKIKLTLSIGVMNHTNNKNLTLEDFLGFADNAMYKSKHKGRNNVTSYSFNKKKNEPALEV